MDNFRALLFLLSYLLLLKVATGGLIYQMEVWRLDKFITLSYKKISMCDSDDRLAIDLYL